MKNKDRSFNNDLITEIADVLVKHCNSNKCNKCTFNDEKNYPPVCWTKFTLHYLSQEYKPKKVFTDIEKTITKHMKIIEFIGRNQNNSLVGFDKRPYKIKGNWICDHAYAVDLSMYSDLFHSISFDDNEATLIKAIYE